MNLKQNNLLQKYIDQRSYSIDMKYRTIPIIITFLLAVNFTTMANAQITLSETQKQEIKETCVLDSTFDVDVYLYQLNEDKTNLSDQSEYKKNCMEIMINAYENNESHDEMMDKLADLWLDTFA